MVQLNEDGKGFILWSAADKHVWRSDGASVHVGNLYLTRDGAQRALNQVQGKWGRTWEIREVDLSFLVEGVSDDTVE